jgi:hypothetical protein
LEEKPRKIAKACFLKLLGFSKRKRPQRKRKQKNPKNRNKKPETKRKRNETKQNKKKQKNPKEKGRKEKAQRKNKKQNTFFWGFFWRVSSICFGRPPFTAKTEKGPFEGTQDQNATRK